MWCHCFNKNLRFSKNIKMKLIDLMRKIQSVCPIEGLSEDGRIDFKQEATDQQRIAAREIFEKWSKYPDPKWKEFGEELFLNPHYVRITTHDNFVNGLKTTLELMLKISADGDLRIESIQGLWNAIAARSSPTPEELTAIDRIIKDNAIDQFFTLKADGTMVNAFLN